jgi:predicted Ser/Thr protein kinase
MSEPHCCPELEGLRRALIEPASPEEAERLARHLEVCGECGETIDQLLEQDTLVGTLRQPTQAEPEAEGPVVRGLIARLQALRNAAPSQGTDLGTDKTHGGLSVGDESSSVAEWTGVPERQTGLSVAEGFDFLAPPQGPGEIGRLGAYRIVKVLGTGGMGVVFLAEDTQLQRYVALKAIRPALASREQTRERFLREARAMAAVKNDHVVTIHQVGEDRGVPFLAMELMEGQTLDERLKRERRLPLADVLRIGRETATGLEAAHRRGLIHRDIKPSNIWLEAGSGRVKILDFGLARAAHDDSQLTQSGTVLGTPSYMPPEQAQDLPADHRSDLFSLGCVLYQACTGQLPFQGRDVMSRLLALATVSPSPPREVNAAVPTAVSELIVRLLCKDPAGRPESAAAVAEALAAAERELAAAEPALPPPAVTLPAARRRVPWRWLIATAASGALLLAAIWAGQIIIRITHKDGQVTEIRTAAGAKVEVIEEGQASSKTSPSERPALAKPSTAW